MGWHPSGIPIHLLSSNVTHCILLHAHLHYPSLFVKGWALVATDDLRAALHYSCTACGAGKYLASSSDPAAHNDPSKCSWCPEGFSSHIPYTTPHVPDATDFSNRVQCAADGLWYACGDPYCGGVRACTSNAGLGSCACDTAEELNLVSNGTGVNAEGTGAPACSICAAGRFAEYRHQKFFSPTQQSQLFPIDYWTTASTIVDHSLRTKLN